MKRRMVAYSQRESPARHNGEYATPLRRAGQAGSYSGRPVGMIVNRSRSHLHGLNFALQSPLEFVGGQLHGIAAAYQLGADVIHHGGHQPLWPTEPDVIATVNQL